MVQLSGATYNPEDFENFGHADKTVAGSDGQKRQRWENMWIDGLAELEELAAEALQQRQQASDAAAAANSDAAAAHSERLATEAATVQALAHRQAAAQSAVTAAGLVAVRRPADIMGMPPVWAFDFSDPAGVASSVIGSTSGKWIRSPSGLWTLAPAGTAPISYELPTGRCRGLRVEGQVINPVIQPSDFSASAWARFGTGSVTVNATVAPDGTQTADLLSDTDTAADAAYWQQAFTVANDTATYCPSVFLAPGTAVASELRAYLIGGTTPINGGLGAKVTWAGRTVSGSAGARVDEDANNFLRLSIPIQNNGTGNTTLITRIYPASQATGVTGTCYAWQAQVDPRALPSSIIPGTTTPVTRLADANTFALSRAGGHTAAGTIYAEFETDGAAPSGVNQTVLVLDDGTTGNFISLLRWENNQGLLLYVRAGGVTQVLQASAAITDKTLHKAAVSWKPGTVGLSLDGVTVVPDTACTVPTGLTTARLGHGLGGEYLNGWIRNLECYPRWADTTARAPMTAM